MAHAYLPPSPPPPEATVKLLDLAPLVFAVAFVGGALLAYLAGAV